MKMSQRKWSKWLQYVAAVNVVAVAVSVQGALIVSENFDYTLGSAIASGGTLGTAGTDGWTNSWSFSTYTGQIVSGLSMSGVDSSGNALKVTRNNTGYLYRRFDSLTAGTYYFSMLFLRSDAANLASSENLLLRIQNETGSTAATGWDVAMGTSSTEGSSVFFNGGSAVNGTDVYTWNDTAFMLAKLTVAANGDATIWESIYKAGDTIPTDEGSIVWAVTSSGNVGTTGFAAGLQLVLPSGIESIAIDEIKVGTQLGDVIPEPATIGLLGVGVSVAVVARRMKVN